jgi:hypothetical protein
MGNLGTEKGRHVKVKKKSSILILVLVAMQVFSQVDTLLKVKLSASPGDSSGIAAAPVAVADSSSLVPPADSLSGSKSISLPAPTSATFKNLTLTNVVLKSKKVRTTGWGEYVVGGHCLCCDNMRSIDCITVQTTNRTDKLRIKQIVDGKIDRDTSNNSTYFGELYEREEQTRPVEVLMAEIALPKLYDIYKVEVFTVADSLKRKNVPFNCELAYYDQFDRLQWTKKVANSGKSEVITFEFEKPIFTKSILLKVRDGRNKITEVAVFAEDTKE